MIRLLRTSARLALDGLIAIAALIADRHARRQYGGAEVHDLRSVREEWDWDATTQAWRQRGAVAPAVDWPEEEVEAAE